MRIIDKNTDFYDYLQHEYKDASVVFDRVGSFVVSKEMMGRSLYLSDAKPPYYRFVLLQVCHTFWLFLFQVKEASDWGEVTSYSGELITSWKNYDKRKELVSLNTIIFSPTISRTIKSGSYLFPKYDRSLIEKRADTLIQAINNNDYKIDYTLDNMRWWCGKSSKINKENGVPILKECGIAGMVNPLDIYLAFDEFFSLEKTSQERTASIGITDKEKIENHGFDSKTSFRGKRRSI